MTPARDTPRSTRDALGASRGRVQDVNAVHGLHAQRVAVHIAEHALHRRGQDVAAVVFAEDHHGPAYLRMADQETMVLGVAALRGLVQPTPPHRTLHDRDHPGSALHVWAIGIRCRARATSFRARWRWVSGG